MSPFCYRYDELGRVENEDCDCQDCMKTVTDNMCWKPYGIWNCKCVKCKVKEE